MGSLGLGHVRDSGRQSCRAWSINFIGVDSRVYQLVPCGGSTESKEVNSWKWPWQSDQAQLYQGFAGSSQPSISAQKVFAESCWSHQLRHDAELYSPHIPRRKALSSRDVPEIIALPVSPRPSAA